MTPWLDEIRSVIASTDWTPYMPDEEADMPLGSTSIDHCYWCGEELTRSERDPGCLCGCCDKHCEAHHLDVTRSNVGEGARMQRIQAKNIERMERKRKGWGASNL